MCAAAHASALGLKAGIDTSALLGTTYQQGKFGKHTSTSGSSSELVRTVLDSTQTTDYAKCIEATIANGFVELMGQQKKILSPRALAARSASSSTGASRPPSRTRS